MIRKILCVAPLKTEFFLSFTFKVTDCLGRQDSYIESKIYEIVLHNNCQIGQMINSSGTEEGKVTANWKVCCGDWTVVDKEASTGGGRRAGQFYCPSAVLVQ